jgi:hypothetical protein
MVLYRSLQPGTDRQKSPRKAARERVTPEVERLTGEAVAALPPAPTKLQQLEALVRAGRVEDPLAGAECVARPFPDPPPQAGEGTAREQAEREEAGTTAVAGGSLLQRTRYLYEQTVVPVREIARLLGVSERTLYKYVRRYDWARRHVCLERDEAVRAGNRGRTLMPRQGSPHHAFARVKGAGGRFITYEERGTPQALSPSCGPKALDPLAAEAAGALCERAAAASNLAVSEVVAAATIEKANACASRIKEASARTLGEAARTLRAVTQAALADDARDEAERAELKRQLREKAAELGRVEAARRHLQAELDAMVVRERDRKRQEALARAVERTSSRAENETLAERVRNDPLWGPRVRKTWD